MAGSHLDQESSVQTSLEHLSHLLKPRVTNVTYSSDSINDNSNSNANPFLKFLVCGDVQDIVQISLTWHVSRQVCWKTTELLPVVDFRRLPYHSRTMPTNWVNMSGILSCIPWVSDSNDSNWDDLSSMNLWTTPNWSLWILLCLCAV